MEYFTVTNMLFPGMAGLLAAGAMGEFAVVCSKLGLSPVNPIEAVGSTLANSYHHAYRIGWAMHLLAGIFFGMVYHAILHPIVGANPWLLLAGGATIGAVHGFIVGFFIAIYIGEYNRYEQYRDSYMGLALIYLAAHICYGALLGTLLALQSGGFV